MISSNFKLLKKIPLTYDVFELVFETDSTLDSKPGQFITFMLPKTKFARAYSILKQEGNIFHFIVRRLENGRGGSKELCDLEISSVLKGLGPIGHFIVEKNNKNKLFIGTGTGIVPFFYHINFLLTNGFSGKSKLILGNREQKDLYYIKEFELLKGEKFDFEVFLSQEETKIFNFGRVYKFLTKESVESFEEFYICGNPYMVDEVILRLKDFGVLEQNIFTEKY